MGTLIKSYKEEQTTAAKTALGYYGVAPSQAAPSGGASPSSSPSQSAQPSAMAMPEIRNIFNPKTTAYGGTTNVTIVPPTFSTAPPTASSAKNIFSNPAIIALVLGLAGVLVIMVVLSHG